MRFPIGTSDFRELRRDRFDYVDKSGFIADLVRAPDRVFLFPRPRRFGKTLNLSMLRYWFERDDEDRSPLFAGLAVESAGPDVRDTFQRFPTIFLTFKDVKQPTWAGCRADMALLLRAEVARLRPIWEPAEVNTADRAVLVAIADGVATDVELHAALRLLTQALRLATGERAVLLIDEYDTPIHAGWSCGYYDEAIAFFRSLLSAGLKDNAHLERGVLTGILRVAKESLFSGLNNVTVHSLLSRQFASWFGFTESEVRALCEGVGPAADLDGIRAWYDGYRMGDTVVYNPWSVLRYLSNISDGFVPYWVITASNELLRQLLVEGGMGIHDDLALLMRGGELQTAISESIQLRDVSRTATTLWSFLLFLGYLKASSTRQEEGQIFATLTIPNLEVRTTYREMFDIWLEEGLGTRSAARSLANALLSGDAETFGGLLERLVIESLSFFDAHRRTPEAVYQAFVVGLLVQLDATHIVDSNRESGFGRYDVCVRPRTPGRAGAVLELKSYDPERWSSPAEALDAAMTQIADRAYVTTLRQAGADPVWQWGVVFDGKRARVRVERG